MKLESLNERAASNLSARHVSGRCLCGAVELEIDFPAFWAWHDHSRGEPSRARRRVCDLYRLLAQARLRGEGPKKHRSLRRCEDRVEPEASAPGAGHRCFTSASARRIWSISHGHSSPAVPAASPAITWPSRSFRIGPTQATGLSPLRAIPESSGNARNRAGARAALITLSSSTGASRPRVRISSGEGICVPKTLCERHLHRELTSVNIEASSSVGDSPRGRDG